jgi:hypothetical protein
MNRIEIINKLKELEERKASFEAVLHDVTDYYCKNVGITVILGTNAFERNRKYLGNKIDVDDVIFKGYLVTEINKIESKINELIKELTK